MKKLSEVNMEDARKILHPYGQILLIGNWKLTDESESIREPCKKLSSRHNSYLFWFMNDSIDIDCNDDEKYPFGLDSKSQLDTKAACYLKAAELGYEIPALTKMDLFVFKNYYDLLKKDFSIKVKKLHKEKKKVEIIKACLDIRTDVIATCVTMIKARDFVTDNIKFNRAITDKDINILWKFFRGINK